MSDSNWELKSIRARYYLLVEWTNALLIYHLKVIPRVSNPNWSEQFDLHTYPDQSKVLEISMFGRDEIGKCSLNLNDLAKEETHKIWISLQHCGSLLLLISISGTLGSETISDLKAYEDRSEQHKSLIKKYVNTLNYYRMN